MLVFSISARTEKPKTCFFYVGLLILLITALSLQANAQSTTLYTPYTKISVPPGETINYSIDVINKGSSIRNAAVSVSGLPKDWTYTLKSGIWAIEQLSVLPGDKKTLNLQVQVPLQINKGTYRFWVNAKGIGQLPLTVVVSKEGAFKTEFSSGQPNMQGAANSTFTYTATLRNGTGADQVYALHTDRRQGWNITFKADYKQVSSVSIEANKSKDITIEVDPPDGTPAGAYKIPIIAETNASSAKLTLDMAITGSYGLQLTTPNGLLSAETTAGDDKRVELSVRNTGTAELKDIELQATAPSGWEVSFEPKKMESLPAGKVVQAFATIKADKHAIVGDYVTNLEAKTSGVSSKADFRISVEASLLSGWLGLMIILAAIGGVYYLFRKYGRR